MALLGWAVAPPGGLGHATFAQHSFWHGLRSCRKDRPAVWLLEQNPGDRPSKQHWKRCGQGVLKATGELCGQNQLMAPCWPHSFAGPGWSIPGWLLDPCLCPQRQRFLLPLHVLAEEKPWGWDRPTATSALLLDQAWVSCLGCLCNNLCFILSSDHQPLQPRCEFTAEGGDVTVLAFWCHVGH